MMKIGKGYNFKIIALVVAVTFFLSSTAYGIDLSKKPHLRTHILSNSEEGRNRLKDGLTAMLNLKGLTPKQHSLLNQALGFFFVGLNEVREDIHVISEDELAKIDPDSNLSGLQDLKVYRFTRGQLIKALKDIGASQKDIAYITTNLISHPGRFRDKKGTLTATNLFILDEHYRLLTQLNAELRTQWARHERAHLDNITRSEKEVQIDYPLKDVVKALKSQEDRQIQNPPHRITKPKIWDRLKRFGLAAAIGTTIFISDIDLAAQGNTAAKETISTIDPAKLIDLAQQGNIDAVYILKDLAAHGNTAAFNALKDLAQQGNRDAVYSLIDLAAQGNTAAKETIRTIDPAKLIDLAQQGNIDAVYSLKYLAAGGNTAAKETIRTIDPAKFKDLAQQGNTVAVETLIDLAGQGNTAAFNALKDLAQQGNKDAVYSLKDLAGQGNTAAKETIRTIDPAKFIDLAQQGNRGAFYRLKDLAAGGNTAAFNALKDLAQQENSDAVYRLKDLAAQGNTAAFNALKDIFNNTRGLKDFIYYQIADALLEVIASQDINIPQEKLEAFKGDFKKVLSHMEFDSEVNSPEVMRIAYKSIDLLGTEVVRSAASAIEEKFHRPPQRIGFYLCMPEVVAPLVEAYKEIDKARADLSFSYFVGAAFAEGYIKYARDVLGGRSTSFDVAGPIGLDRFGKVEESLKEKGFLSRDYKGFGFASSGWFTFTNEAKETYPEGGFKTPKDALIAHGALLLEDRARFLKDVQRLGHDVKLLTEDEIGVGTYLYYCSRNPVQHVKKHGPDLIGKIKNGRHGQALFNAQWPQATSRLLSKIYGDVLKLSGATQGSPSKCLETFHSEFKDKEVYIKDLIKRRIKSGGGYFEKTTVYTELKYLIKLNLVKRVKGKRGYYELTDFARGLTPRQLDYISNIPELKRYEIRKGKVAQTRREIYNNIQNFSRLKNKVVFFLGEEVKHNPLAFTLALGKLRNNNIPVVLAKDYQEKEELTKLIYVDLRIPIERFRVMTFEEAGIEPVKIDSYLMQILGIDGLNCIPLTPVKLKLHPELREAERRV